MKGQLKMKETKEMKGKQDVKLSIVLSIIIPIFLIGCATGARQAIMKIPVMKIENVILAKSIKDGRPEGISTAITGTGVPFMCCLMQSQVSLSEISSMPFV